MKFYLVATEDMAKQMQECCCVKPCHFGSECKYIPAATYEHGALELFFASRHAPPQAATEGGLILWMLEFELPDHYIAQLFSEEKIVLNRRYNPPAVRLTVDLMCPSRDVPFKWSMHRLESPLGVDEWARMALRFRPFHEAGTCVQCEQKTSVWQSTQSTGYKWYCGKCWNEWNQAMWLSEEAYVDRDA